MHSLIELLPRWSREATDPLPPEPAEAVQRVFARLGSHATADVLALYGSVGGMRMMDDEYWRLWSLEEVGNQPPSEHGILFSDYLISCWEYRIKPVSALRSAVYVDHFDGTPPALVASSLKEFFDRYLLNARALLDAASMGMHGA